MVEELLVEEEEEPGKENRRPQGEENVYESPVFDEDSQDNELTPQKEKHLSIRNFV